MDIIYDKLREYGFVDSQYDFSRRYLRKSRSYYSACKARKKQLSKDALVSLALELEKDAALLEGGRAYKLSASVRTLAAGVTGLAGAAWDEVRQLRG